MKRHYQFSCLFSRTLEIAKTLAKRNTKLKVLGSNPGRIFLEHFVNWNMIFTTILRNFPMITLKICFFFQMKTKYLIFYENLYTWEVWFSLFLLFSKTVDILEGKLITAIGHRSIHSLIFYLFMWTSEINLDEKLLLYFQCLT